MTNEKDFPPQRPSESAFRLLRVSVDLKKPIHLSPEQSEALLERDHKLRGDIARLVYAVDKIHPIDKPHDPSCQVCAAVSIALGKS